MSSPPVVLYSRTIDPAGVLSILRAQGDVTLVGTDGSWSQATVTWKSGWFKRHKLVVNHSVDYYAGSDWPAQMRGMIGYFQQFCTNQDVFSLITAFRFSLSFIDAPAPVDPNDPVQALLQRIAAHLDGVFFLPGHLLDRHGRVLVDPEDQRDPEARFPVLPPPPIPPVKGGQSAGGSAGGGAPEAHESEEQPLRPPDPARVARRALVLGALSMRAMAEMEPDLPDMDGRREGIRQWLADVGAAEELEPAEREFLGQDEVADPQALVNQVWRLEGLGVLSWALGLTELARYDALHRPDVLWGALHLLQDPTLGRSIVAEASLRPESERAAMGTHLLALHWRVRDYRIRPRAMDFVAFSKDCWFGSFALDGFGVVDGDLALEGTPIHDCSDEVRGRTASAALERRLAMNWLDGWSEVYSETDTST